MMKTFWLARNLDGTLYRFDKEPFYESGDDPVTHKPLNFWNSNGIRVRIGDIDATHFPEITFDNSPVEVQLKVIAK